MGRRYSDSPCGGAIAQDYGATVVNNSVFADSSALFASSAGFDAGISLESACQATVVHNTVYSTQAPFSSMEYRFDTTSGKIENNLLSHNLRDRGAGQVELLGNLQETPGGCFVDAAAGDLHLAPGCAAVDAGVAGVAVAQDIDGQQRDGSPDVGADELGE